MIFIIFNQIFITMSNFFAHSSAILDEGCTIGDNSKIWHFCHIMPKAVLGQGCNLGQNVFVADGVVLGNNVKVQNNVSLYTGVTCEDDVFLGPSAVFTNVINPRSAVVRKAEYLPTLIKKGATIGANATIVCGATIGEYAFVAAGALVSRDVPNFGLVMGVPARLMGYMSHFGHRLSFDKDNLAVCPESGYVYKLENGVCSVV